MGQAPSSKQWTVLQNPMPINFNDALQHIAMVRFCNILLLAQTTSFASFRLRAFTFNKPAYAMKRFFLVLKILALLYLLQVCYFWVIKLW
jgi:hypothetical protein